MIRKDPPETSGAVIKRARTASPTNEQQIIISAGNNEKEQGLIRTVTRTSGLDVCERFSIGRVSWWLIVDLQAPIVSLAGAHGVCATVIYD